MEVSRLYTIGTSRRSARDFFSTLQAAGVRRLLDVRRHNTSQLAGFSKRDDLAYLAGAVADIAYLHLPRLAPAADLLAAYRTRRVEWEEFARRFRLELRARGAIDELDRALFIPDPACLLCSERAAERCHRRLVAEAVQARWPELDIIHL